MRLPETKVCILWGAIEIAAEILHWTEPQSRWHIGIVVELFGEKLKFRIPVPIGATVGAALVQLGKRTEPFILLRNGAVFPAGDDTPLLDGDRLCLLKNEHGQAA